LDICSALEICEQKRIIHRDIKDENIFVTSDGKFKLGDFGIAKELTRLSLASSIRGTPSIWHRKSTEESPMIQDPTCIP